MSLEDLIYGWQLRLTSEEEICIFDQGRSSSFARSVALYRVMRREAEESQMLRLERATGKNVSDNLRIVSSTDFYTYLLNTRLFRLLGNERFAVRMSGDAICKRRGYSIGVLPPEQYVLFHSWLPGMTGVDFSTPKRMFETDLGPKSLQSHMLQVLQSACWLDGGPIDIPRIVRQAIDIFGAIQNYNEFEQLLRTVQCFKPRAVLEIGTARGGLLYGIAQVSHPECQILSIDLPGGKYGGGQSEEERRVFSSFIGPKQHLSCIVGDSHDISTLRTVEGILFGRPLDVLLIDGDHSYRGVKADFSMYRHLVRKGGWIIFHDIRMLPEIWGEGNDVGVFWREIAQYQSTYEIVDKNAVCRPDIAEHESHSWGFGLLEVAGT